MTRPAWSMEWGWSAHREGCSSSAPPLPQCNISVFFYMQTNSWWDRWLWNGGTQGPAAKDHIPVLQWRRVPQINMCQALAHLALKGTGRQHSDCFYLTSAQNTPMTNSEPKYHPIALLRHALCPKYPPCIWKKLTHPKWAFRPLKCALSV